MCYVLLPICSSCRLAIHNGLNMRSSRLVVCQHDSLRTSIVGKWNGRGIIKTRNITFCKGILIYPHFKWIAQSKSHNQNEYFVFSGCKWDSYRIGEYGMLTINHAPKLLVQCCQTGWVLNSCKKSHRIPPIFIKSETWSITIRLQKMVSCRGVTTLTGMQVMSILGWQTDGMFLGWHTEPQKRSDTQLRA